MPQYAQSQGPLVRRRRLAAAGTGPALEACKMDRLRQSLPAHGRPRERLGLPPPAAEEDHLTHDVAAAARSGAAAACAIAQSVPSP